MFPCTLHAPDTNLYGSEQLQSCLPGCWGGVAGLEEGVHPGGKFQGCCITVGTSELFDCCFKGCLALEALLEV